jgi:hypothetical protein
MKIVMHDGTGEKLREILERLDSCEHDQNKRDAHIAHLLRRILHILESPSQSTPITISFKESTMLDPVAGNTLVYTGTTSPAGSAFPAGTTYTVTSSDPTVTPTVDATGLIVTIPLPSTFIDDPANPFNVVWATSVFVPSPADSPVSLTATITPSIPTPPSATPTSVAFAQTA